VVYLAGIAAQTVSLLAGLAWSEVFAFFVPAVLAAEGSNLRSGAYLMLNRRPRLSQATLAVAIGGASFALAGGLMALWMLVLPERLIDLMDVAHLFELPPREQAILGLLAATAAPICEEAAFRGYILSSLRTRLSPGPAILGAAVLFATMHLDPVRWPALVVLGVLYGWLVWRSGSLWPAVVAHAVNNGIASVLTSIRVAPSGLQSAATEPDALFPLVWIALGILALLPLLAAYRFVTPAPPPLDLQGLRRNPGDVSIGFRVDRIPAGLRWIALAGLLLLGLIGAFAAWHELHPKVRRSVTERDSPHSSIHQAFQVSPFLELRRHRMVRRLVPLVDQLEVHARLEGRLLHRVEELLGRDACAATRRHEQAARSQYAQRSPIERRVAGNRGFHGAL
jgi:membrane protease YdiL (CAAX protease family)